MCLICVDYEKEKLTLKEAWVNLGEMHNSLDEEHRNEVLEKLWNDAISGEKEIDEQTWNAIFQGIMVL